MPCLGSWFELCPICTTVAKATTLRAFGRSHWSDDCVENGILNRLYNRVARYRASIRLTPTPDWIGKR